MSDEIAPSIADILKTIERLVISISFRFKVARVAAHEAHNLTIDTIQYKHISVIRFSISDTIRST